MLHYTQLGMQASIFSTCPKTGQTGRVAAGRASGVKMGDVGSGLLISLDRVALSWTVGVICLCCLPLHH